jgi:hypothetical protein
VGALVLGVLPVAPGAGAFTGAPEFEEVGPELLAVAPEAGAVVLGVLTGMTTRYIAVSEPDVTVTTMAVYPAGGVTVEITEVSPP